MFSDSFFFVSYAILNLLIADLLIHYFLHTLRKKVKMLDGICVKDDSTTEDELYEDLSSNMLVNSIDKLLNQLSN